ncbi:MAG TPA: hypothetical protein VFC63_12005 [Blastocatellia bacterium]|nr:hypothetical protein [Blastocatellia bacterium]
MTPKASIEKGKRLEKWFCQQLEAYGIDANARREIGSGSGKKKGDIYSSLDFLVEAKNEATPHFTQNIDQAKAQAKIGFHNPDKWLLIQRDPRTKEFDDVYAVLDIHQFLTLYKKAMEPKIANPDTTVAYKLRRLIQSAKDVLKDLEK